MGADRPSIFLRRLRGSQSGLTIVETMVAAALLLVGLLGTVKLIDVASSSQGDSKAREGATNLAREVLEDAHATAYTQIGSSGWITSPLANLSNDSGSTNTVTTPNSSTAQTTLTRRKISYTVAVNWCSIDDQKDGYGPHSSSITWCSDSTTTGSGDIKPEDMKRVTATVTYSVNGNAKTLSETVTFSATGGMVAPSVTQLCASGAPITTAGGSQCTGPFTITDATATDQQFTGFASGAADMKFTVNGVETTTGVTNNGNGSWTYDWQIAGLKDGSYTIGAIAVDALGNRSQPMTQQVTLSRGAPITPQGVVGGYNYVNPTGVGNGGSLVVELQWQPNAEGTVTGYEVLRGATSVCGGQTNLSTSCIDTSPTTTPGAVTTYTVKTWYLDSTNTAQSVSTTYNVTAPPAVNTQFWWQNTTGISQTNCAAPVTSGSKQDLVSSYSPGTAATWTSTNGNSIVGCMAPLTSSVDVTGGFNNITFSGYFKNTSASSDCNLQVYVYDNGNFTFMGNGWNFSQSNLTIPRKTNSTALFSETLNGLSSTYYAGDQLSVQITGFTGGGCGSTTMTYNSSANPVKITLPLTSNEPVPPNRPSGLSVTANSDGTRTLTWTAPTSSSGVPAPDFYRIYRDGTATSNRVDTTDATSTTVSSASTAGATTLTVADATGLAANQSVLVDTGSNQDVMTISSISGNTITFTSGMSHAHAANVPVTLRSVSWTDTTAGGTSHSYRVTATSQNLVESNMAGPVTG